MDTSASDRGARPADGSAELSWRAQRGALRRMVVRVCAPTAGGLALLSGLAHLSGIPFGDLIDDPVAEPGAPVYLGLVSYLGVLIWWSSAAICAFTLGVLRGSLGGMRAFLATSACIGGLLALDDLLRLHEVGYKVIFRNLESLTYPAYGLLVGGLVFRFRNLIRRTEFAVLLLAVAFFALSAGLDVLASARAGILSTPAQRATVEAVDDACKLLGIVSWTAYYWRLCGRALAAGPRG